MRKLVLAALALIMSFNNYSQQQFINVPEIWETDSWDGANWNLLSRTTYTFNSECLPFEVLSEFIDFGTGNLQNAAFLTVTYNSSDQPIENINQIWNAITSQWENNLKSNFFYSGDNITEAVNYIWANGNWILKDRVLNSYNTSNLIAENIFQNWDLANGMWVNFIKTETTYNVDQTLDVITDFSWDTGSSAWVNVTQELYAYTSGLLNSVTTEQWSGSTWGNDEIDTITYDANDFIIQILETEWNGGSYDNDKLVLRTNNDDGNPTEMTTQTWIGSWFNTTRDRRTYPDCAALSTEDFIADNELNIYPNPASSEVNIGVNSEGKLSIMDLGGRVLHKRPLDQGQNAIDVSLLAEGIFLFVVESQKRKVLKRIVIKH